MSQKVRILNYLRSAKSKGITQKDAIQYFDCYRLAARILNLREDGHNITTIREEVGDKTFARYVLIQGNEQ